MPGPSPVTNNKATPGGPTTCPRPDRWRHVGTALGARLVPLLCGAACGRQEAGRSDPGGPVCPRSPSCSRGPTSGSGGRPSGDTARAVLALLTSSKAQLYVDRGCRASEVLAEVQRHHLAPHPEGQAEDVPLLVHGELAAVALRHQPPGQGLLGEGPGAPTLRGALGLRVRSWAQSLQEALGAGPGAPAQRGGPRLGCRAGGLPQGPSVRDAAARPVHGRECGRVQLPARRQRVDLLELAQGLGQGGARGARRRQGGVGSPGPRPRGRLGPAVFGQEPLRGRDARGLPVGHLPGAAASRPVTRRPPCVRRCPAASLPRVYRWPVRGPAPGVRACVYRCACRCARRCASGFSYLRRQEVGDGRGPAQRPRRQVRAVAAVEQRLGPGGPGAREPAEQQDAGGEHGRPAPPASARLLALPGRAARSLL